MMWAFTPYNTIETNNISVKFVGIPHDAFVKSLRWDSARSSRCTSRRLEGDDLRRSTGGVAAERRYWLPFRIVLSS